MAQIKVDSTVMRSKAETIKVSANKIKALYDEMLLGVEKTVGAMQGVTIEQMHNDFKEMDPKFEQLKTDLTSYSAFLEGAAETYDLLNSNGSK